MKLKGTENGVGSSKGTDANLRQMDHECPKRVTVSLANPKQNFVVGTGDRPAPLSPPLNNSKHNRRDYISRVLPSLPPLNFFSPDHLALSHNGSRRSQHIKRKLLKRVPEELDFESVDNMLEHDDFLQGSTSTKLLQPQGPQYYGAFGSENGSATSGFGEDGDDLSDDDYELLLDERLARDGLYRGNYRNLLLLYTVVPLTTLFSFICLALVPTLVFPTKTPSLFPYPPYLSFPILEVLTATALWSLSYLLRDFLYATALFIASFTISQTIITTILSATLQTTSNLLFRQIAIPILLIPYYASKQGYGTWQDVAFRRVWWVALGWAAVEAVVGVEQGYESIALYKDVLVSVNTSVWNTEMETRRNSRLAESRNTYSNERLETPQKQSRDDVNATSKRMDSENQRQWLNAGLASSPIQRTSSRSVGSSHISTDEAPPPISNERQPLLRVLTQKPNDESERLQAESEVERDLDQLVALKSRQELEEAYGMPFIRIPVFLSCLHRLNSILSSLGICLLLTSAYMQSTFVLLPPIASNLPLALTIPPIFISYTLLGMMHAPLILPRIGVHTFVYIELLVSLGFFFGALGVWGALS
ncbi:hypothetical protein BYT27DRAFT_7204351 [Phlegmacium glaucopus]|nr:hypothetical protein BYT27DRAFT_7204351 [Phlegmacium glaucopus]